MRKLLSLILSLVFLLSPLRADAFIIDFSQIESIFYSNEEITEIYYNNELLWSKGPKYYIQAGEVVDSSYISGTYTAEVQHTNCSGSVSTHSNQGTAYWGASASGMYSGDHSCGRNPYVSITVTLDSSLVGKTVTMDVYYFYSSRYYGTNSAYVKNGNETLITLSGQNKEVIQSKKFTVTSTSLTFYVSFPCDNSSWSPSAHVGIQNLYIE